MCYMSHQPDCMSCEGSDILSDELFLKDEIRKRRTWADTDSLASVNSRDLDLLDIDDDDDEEEDDGAGCPLPSTPEDTELLEQEVSYTDVASFSELVLISTLFF